MWVLQSNLVKDSQVRPFAEAFRAMGVPFVDVAIMPFSDGFFDEPRLPNTDVIPYGSTTLMRIALQRGWRWLFYNDQFQVPAWLIHRDDMLNSDAAIVTAQEAAKRFAYATQDECWFVRPTEDFKAFSGTVAQSWELAKLMQGGQGSTFNFTPETMVAISEVKPILREWRYFIVGGKLISGSVYRAVGERCVYREDNDRVLGAAQALADKWLPHPTCVMDVAETDSGLRVVEFNCLNASGIYDHDVPAIVRAVTDYCSTPQESYGEKDSQ